MSGKSKAMKSCACLLLVLAMLLGMCGTAFAADGVNTAAELQSAFTAGGSVTLTGDIEVSDSLTVPAGTTVVLDLNGHAISGSHGTKGHSMIVNKGGLTIKDSSAAKTGKITYTYTGAADTSYGAGNYTITNSGTLTVNGGAIENATAAMSHMMDAIDNNSGTGNAVLTINGGSVVCGSYIAIRQFANSTTYENSVIINGGSVFGGKRAVWVQLPSSNSSLVQKASVSVTGGTVSNDSDTDFAIYAYSFGASAADLELNISGGTFNGDVGIYVPDFGTLKENNISISGGDFRGENGVVCYGEVDFGFITGGAFAGDVSEYLADEVYLDASGDVVERTALKYVALGDSMTNGYGMEGYYPAQDNDPATYQTAGALNEGNRYGYLRNAPGAWPSLVAEALKEQGYAVDLKNLSISGMRPEELRAILDPAYTGDAYTKHVFLPGDDSNGLGGSEQRLCRAIGCTQCGAHDDTNCAHGLETVRADYNKYIAQADLISIHLGTNNFGTIVTNKLMSMMDLDGWSIYDDITWGDQIHDPELKALYEDLKGRITEALAGTVGVEGSEKIVSVADIMAYGVTGFFENYTACFEIIREMNPTADIVVVGVSNPLEGTSLTYEGTTVDASAAFEIVTDAINGFLGAYVGEGVYFADVEELDIMVDAAGRDEMNPVFAAKLVDTINDDFMGGTLSAYETVLIQYVCSDEAARASMVSTYPALAQFAAVYDAVVSAAADKDMSLDTFLAMFRGVGLENLLDLSDLTGDATQDILQVYIRCLLAEGIGIHPSEAGHVQIAEAVVSAMDNGYTGGDIAKETLEEYARKAADLIAEYYDDAYAYAYDYAQSEGYIGGAVTAIDGMIETLNGLDLSGSEMTEEFKAELEAEIAQAVEALEAARALLLEADVLDQNTLNAAAALLDEAVDAILYVEHLLVQAGEDVTELAVIPALKEARRVLTEEIIPQIVADLTDAVQAGTAWLLEQVGQAWDALVDAAVEAALYYGPEAADWVYDYLYENPAQVIAFVQKYGDDALELIAGYQEEVFAVLAFLSANCGDEVVAFVMDNYQEILAVMCRWLEEHGGNAWALILVYVEELGLLDNIPELPSAEDIEAALEAVRELLEDAANGVYDSAVETLRDALDQVKALIEANADKIEQAVLAEIESVLAEIQEILDDIAAGVYEDMGQALADLGAAVEKLMDVTAGVVDEAVREVIDALEQAYIDATTDEYQISSQSFYVAIGDGTAVSESYVDALAAELGVAHENLAEDGLTAEKAVAVVAGNADVVAGADLITLGFSNTAMIDYMTEQMHNAIMGKPVDALDWTAYVGEEGLPYVERALAEVRGELAAQGLDVSYMGVNVVDLLMTGIESYSYAYVGYVMCYPELVNAIREINEEALIVMVGMYDPLDGVVLDLDGTEIAIGDYVGYLVDVTNVHATGYAMLTGEAIYVDAPDVETSNDVASYELIPFVLGMFTGEIDLYPNEDGHDYIKDQILNALTVTATGLLGDADENGVVDSDDAMWILKYDVGMEDRIDPLLADVDGSGVVDSDDAAWILKYDVGMAVDYPVGQPV